MSSYTVVVRKERTKGLYAIYINGEFLEGGFEREAALQCAAEIRVASAYEDFVERMQRKLTMN